MKKRFAFSTEIWAGLFLFGLAIIYWFQANALPRSSLGGSVGSAGMPKLLAVALCVMALLLIVQSLLASSSKKQRDAADLPDRNQVLRAAGFWLIAAAYVLVLPWVGYPIAVAGALLAIGFYYGRKPTLGFFVFAIGGAIALSLLFMKVLDVPMPLGIFSNLST